MIHLKKTSDKKLLCEAPIFSGLDFRNPWNLENERQRWNIFFAVNLHVTSASLLWSNLFVSVQFHLDSDFASAESMITLSQNASSSIHVALEKAGLLPFPVSFRDAVRERNLGQTAC